MNELSELIKDSFNLEGHKVLYRQFKETGGMSDPVIVFGKTEDNKDSILVELFWGYYREIIGLRKISKNKYQNYLQKMDMKILALLCIV